MDNSELRHVVVVETDGSGVTVTVAVYFLFLILFAIAIIFPGYFFLMGFQLFIVRGEGMFIAPSCCIMKRILCVVVKIGITISLMFILLFIFLIHFMGFHFIYHWTGSYV